jgi:hypothetical protein
VLSTEQRSAAPRTLARLVEELRKQELFVVEHLGLQQPRFRLIADLKRGLDNPAAFAGLAATLAAARADAVSAEQNAAGDTRTRLRQRVTAVDTLKAELDDSGVVTGRAVCLALRSDMWALADEFRAVLRSLRQERIDAGRTVPQWLDDPDRARAVVLLDNLDLYDEGFVSGLFELTNQGGLGSVEEPVPLVVSFSLDDGPASQVLRPIAEMPKPYAHVLRLQAFAPGEDILCYHRVLLHPFDDHLFVWEDLSSAAALAVDGSASAESVQKSEAYLRKLLKGRPAKLKTEFLYLAAREAKQKQYLVDADDREILRELGLQS